MGYGFFNVGIMMVAPKGKVPGKRVRGKKGRKGKRSKLQARQDTARPMVTVAKWRGKAAYPLIQVPPHADHLKAYSAGLATA